MLSGGGVGGGAGHGGRRERAASVAGHQLVRAEGGGGAALAPAPRRQGHPPRPRPARLPHARRPPDPGGRLRVEARESQGPRGGPRRHAAQGAMRSGVGGPAASSPLGGGSLPIPRRRLRRVLRTGCQGHCQRMKNSARDDFVK
eukprot:1181784-Prorocentrum_minimum.AAC.1